MKLTHALATAATLMTANTALAALPSAHAPIGVMADHTHQKGELMLSYRHMQMDMSDIYVDDSKITVDDISGSMMNPTEMTMKMDMFGLMYGLSDTQTLMLMTNYLDNDMTMKNSMSDALSKMSSNGFGDTKIALLQNISEHYPFGRTAQINFGLSIPTGAIDETNNSGVRLPYKMQLGSGTFDPSIELTSHGDLWFLKYGYQIGATFRLGHNSEGYSKGEEYNATYWGAYDLNNNFSVSNRVIYQLSTDYDGIDNEIEDVMMSSITRDATKQSGEIIDYAIGVNYASATNTRIAFEYNFPLYRNLNGAQLAKGESFTIALQKAF